MNIREYSKQIKMEEAEKLAKTAFVSVCSECGDILSVRYDLGSCALSHGYCKKCADAIKSKIGERE